ncbi:OmpA family protein [Roseovarius sp. D0-M9]|uniref:OmpA family protein n=1 Tax=Roseovarius sp. D0-M9 TaxID=3127117 RepID=UPI0030105EEE
MQRHWLTSTTALALVLNAAAPLPSSAFQVSEPSVTEPRIATGTRVAENEASTASQDLMESVIGDADATGSTENDSTAEQVAAEVEAAEEAAEAEAEAAAEAEAEAQAAAEAEEAAEAEAQAAQAAEDQAAEQEAAEAQAAEEEAAEAAEAEATAEQEAEATAEAEAEAEAARAAKAAETDAAEQHAEEEAAAAEAEAQADAELQAAEDSAAEQDDQTQSMESGENATPNIAETEQRESGENDTTDLLPEVSAEDQARAAEAADESSAAAAAASEESEVVGTEDVTVTEEGSRASNEEFTTSASGQEAPEAQADETQAPAAQAPAVDADDDDNELLKNLGIAAAAGLGAYAIGRMLDGGGQVVSNTGDRVVVQEPSGSYRVIKDDDTLLRRPGSDVQTQTYSDGSTRSVVVGADGSETVTIRAADGRVLRRTRILPDGREIMLFDDTQTYERVDVTELERAQSNRTFTDYDYSTRNADELRMALNSANGALTDRTYSLNQIRSIDAVRHLVPVIALDGITFRTGSAVIDSAEAQDLAELGNAMVAAINEDPSQVFLIEGHTDTVGDASYNLALSDRRAESVALALTEYFDVPPSNMIVQGYGESDLRVRQQGDIRANRRGAVRNITPLLRGGR